MAGKNKHVFVEAELRYAKVFPENRDMGNEQVDHTATDGMYSVDLIVTDEEKAKMIASGVPEKQGAYDQFRATDDGRWLFKAKRRHKHETWTRKTEDGHDTGEPLIYGPPRVFDYNAAMAAWEKAEKKGPLLDYITPWKIEDGLIGNGSRANVRLKVESGVGTMGKAKGKVFSRVTLEAVALKDIVEYAGGSNEGWY